MFLLPQAATVEMIETLKKLKEQCTIAFVGGSDLVKISEQISVHGIDGESRSTTLELLCLQRVPSSVEGEEGGRRRQRRKENER